MTEQKSAYEKVRNHAKTRQTEHARSGLFCAKHPRAVPAKESCPLFRPAARLFCSPPVSWVTSRHGGPVAHCLGARKRLSWLLSVAVCFPVCGWLRQWHFTFRLPTKRTHSCTPFRLVSSGSLRRRSPLDCGTNRRSPRRRSVAFGQIRWQSLNSVFKTSASCIMWIATILRWCC